MLALSDAAAKAKGIMQAAWAKCKGMDEDVDATTEDIVSCLDNLVSDCDVYNAQTKEADEPDEDQMPGRDR